MKLHENKKLFTDLIRSTSQSLGIKEIFIEKDYWITLVLRNLAKSEFSNIAVFKGGTSLSKAYNLINRFSEDIDIAILNETGLSGNKIKNLIRNIEKEITQGLIEKQIEGTTSKASHFRKTAFEYDSVVSQNSSNKLIVEINSITSPSSFEQKEIKTYIHDFLLTSKNEKYIEDNELQPFYINVLDKRFTLLEKIASLIRFSFDTNVVEGLSGKIRHFYDLYFLITDPDCASFMESEDFLTNLQSILEHDKEISDIPPDWSKRKLKESPLINDFSEIWDKLKDRYTTELTALAFSKIPDEKEVAEKFKILIKLLKQLK